MGSFCRGLEQQPSFIPHLNGQLAQNQVCELKAKEKVSRNLFFQMQLALRGHTEKQWNALNSQNLWNICPLAFVLYCVLTKKRPQQKQFLYLAQLEWNQARNPGQLSIGSEMKGIFSKATQKRKLLGEQIQQKNYVNIFTEELLS